MSPEMLAALAGVALCADEAEAAAAAAARPATGTPSPWALHGRQGIMRMRALVQQRVLKR